MLIRLCTLKFITNFTFYDFVRCFEHFINLTIFLFVNCDKASFILTINLMALLAGSLMNFVKVTALARHNIRVLVLTQSMNIAKL